MDKQPPVPSGQHEPYVPMDGDSELTLTDKTAHRAQRKSSERSYEIRLTGTYMHVPLDFVRS